MNFNSHTDTVVANAVVMVNVLTPGERRGKPYPLPEPAELIDALAKEISDGQRFEESELEDLAGVARELRVVFEAIAASDVDAAAEQVNAILKETRPRPHLSRHDGEPWHVHFHGETGGAAADRGGPSATGLAVVLGSELYDRLGVCTAPHCDRVYVDSSRNGTRRFCSTACQNRVKTAAFRARSQP